MLPRMLPDVWDHLSEEERGEAETWVKNGAPTCVIIAGTYAITL